MMQLTDCLPDNRCCKDIALTEVTVMTLTISIV